MKLVKNENQKNLDAVSDKEAEEAFEGDEAHERDYF